MTANDVKWALDRVKNPETKAFRGNDLKDVTVEAVDAKTIRLTAARSNAALPALLASTFIIAPQSVGPDGKVSKPIGTGPFVFDAWTPGQELRLKKNPAYWQTGGPYLDGIVYKPIPDAPARLAAIRSGTVDVAVGVAPTDLPLINQDPSIDVQLGQQNVISHLDFNTKSAPKPLDDPRVRQAIAHALDKQQLLTIAVGDRGPGSVNNQWFDPGSFWRLNVPDPYAAPNLDQSKALLQQAGVGSGFKTSLLTWSDGRPMAEVVQAQLRKIGVDASIDFAPDFNTYQSRLKAYDYGLLLDSAFPRDDPTALFTFWASTNPNNIYRGGYANSAVDKLLDQAVATSDAAARKDLYARALDTIENQDAASIIFLSKKQVTAVRKAVVHGFTAGTDKLNRVDGGVAATWVTR
jgi:peptide/nickel transport system substrate-binding protein